MTAVAGEKGCKGIVDWKVCETELEDSIKKVLTWSHLIDLPTGVRGGGVQIAGGEDEEDGKKDKKKKEKEGGRNSSPGDQSGGETPQSLAELSFFSRWFF